MIDTLRCGGLANVKGKAIKGILDQVAADQAGANGLASAKNLPENTKLTLQYLHDMEDEEAMAKLISFPRVGPKTANGLMMFCLWAGVSSDDDHFVRADNTTCVPQQRA